MSHEELAALGAFLSGAASVITAACGKRYGMTAGERDWIDWYVGGKQGERPDVPQAIPDRWWDDERWVLARD